MSLISREQLTEGMVLESDAMAKDIMERLPDVFPHRRWDGQAGVGTSWNFPKLHQMMHVADQIRRSVSCTNHDPNACNICDVVYYMT